MKITITKELKEEFLVLDPKGDDLWERLSDVTEHPSAWLRKEWLRSGKCVDFVIVADGEDYGEVTT